MVTIDEVITGMTELILSGKTADVKSTVREALHYLKEYRSKQDTIAEQLAELEQKNDHVCELAITVCKTYERLCKRLAEEYRDDPLSWDELKSMEGKPVWVEYLRDGATYDAEWCIVKDIDDDLLHDTEGYGYGRANKYGDGYGVGWQAYRKERKATGGILTPDPKSKKIGDYTEIKWSEKNDKELER